MAQMEKAPHSHHPDLLIRHFESHLERGLTSGMAHRRQEEFGLNTLPEEPRPGFLHLLWDQINNFLILLLIVAAGVTALIGETTDAIAILAIVILNTVLGVIQESRAERALAALKRMAAPNAIVVRDGLPVTLPARELVPGDIVLLETGNFVPADVRLVESVNLQINESALTGESQPVQKDACIVLDTDLPIGDRVNSAFLGTTISRGRGRGLVIATGGHTQIGMIASMLQSVEEKTTPLQERLDELGKRLAIASLGICAVIFLYGVVRDTDLGLAWTSGVVSYFTQFRFPLIDLFLTAVSLAIAAVPEGLPAVVTICLALGMQRMVSRHVLIRRLTAVETLGCATVICSDKTGTLTQNEMTVVRGWVSGTGLAITGEGYVPRGNLIAEDGATLRALDADLEMLFRIAAQCNDARLETSDANETEPTWRMLGDPTEGALLVAAAKAGIRKAALEEGAPRLAEIPFDAERKRMTTVHANPDAGPGQVIALVKGAPDIVLGLCARIRMAGSEQTLDAATRQMALDANHLMAGRALRVLGFAYRVLDALPEEVMPESVEGDLVFVGLLGMMDPPRPEAAPAIATARQAGVKTVMITGDYSDTARAVAEKIGLLIPGDQVLSGAELDALSEKALDAIVDRVDVYARVSPQHKLRIVEALQRQGHVVAMTGDGVNDAPALKRAEIGVAMGITGTDVAKETANMVLTDDNFASIVAAIEQGRIIYSNIRKFVFYLISCNIGEILIIFLAMLAGLPLPLRPIQLLWLNLVTDGAPALALGLETGEVDTMRHPPRPRTEPVIHREMLVGIGVQAVVMTSAVLAAFVYGLGRYPGNLAAAQTLAFATLILSELLRSFTSRSERLSIFSIGVFSNRWMLWATGSSFVLLLAVIYIPFFDPIFQTAMLDGLDWLVMLPCMLAAPVAAELVKFVYRRRALAGLALKQ
jgi:P-type Ca2+ transporter type 2C